MLSAESLDPVRVLRILLMQNDALDISVEINVTTVGCPPY